MTFSWRLAEVPADHVLAVYGTLRPGRSNFHIVAPVGGTWLPGTIRGTLGAQPTGRYEGYPAFRHDAAGGEVDVDVLVSSDLPDHWDRLDEFEGPGYRRIVVEVALGDEAALGEEVALDEQAGADTGARTIRANVYESWPEGDPASGGVS